MLAPNSCPFSSPRKTMKKWKFHRFNAQYGLQSTNFSGRRLLSPMSRPIELEVHAHQRVLIKRVSAEKSIPKKFGIEIAAR
jgi:hypothetical protein